MQCNNENIECEIIKRQEKEAIEGTVHIKYIMQELKGEKNNADN